MHNVDIEKLLTDHAGLITAAVKEHLPAKLRRERRDIEQDAYLKLLIVLRKPDTTEPTASFIYRVVRGAVVDEVRRLTATRRLSLTPLDDQQQIPCNHQNDTLIEAAAECILTYPQLYLCDKQARAVTNPATADPDSLYLARKNIRTLAAKYMP